MSTLLRGPTSPESLGPGLWFLALAVVVGGLSLFASSEPAGRIVGVLLAAVLVVRGIARLRQARRAAAERRETAKVGTLGERSA